MAASLDEVAEQIRRCRLCPLWHGRKKAVPGDGPASARCMLIGESPGAEEDASGRSFIGRSGKFLDDVLKESGLERKNLFTTGSVKCHSPKNRDPRTGELSTCRPYLLRQIDIIKPKVIVLLGRIAVGGFMGKVKLDEVRGHVFTRDPYRLLPTYHPAAAMRFPARRKPFTDDIATLSSLLL